MFSQSPWQFPKFCLKYFTLLQAKHSGKALKINARCTERIVFSDQLKFIWSLQNVCCWEVNAYLLSSKLFMAFSNQHSTICVNAFFKRAFPTCLATKICFISYYLNLYLQRQTLFTTLHLFNCALWPHHIQFLFPVWSHLFLSSSYHAPVQVPLNAVIVPISSTSSDG